jgi:hypothetical protein
VDLADQTTPEGPEGDCESSHLSMKFQLLPKGVIYGNQRV